MPESIDCSKRARERGTTALETSIAGFLTAVVVAVFYGSAVSVGKLTAESNKQARGRAKKQTLLEHLRKELSQTGLDNRFHVAADGSGISYQKLTGAVQSGDGVSGSWSPTLTIQRDAEGRVVRTGMGKPVSWGEKVRHLEFGHRQGDDYISVTFAARLNGEFVKRKIHIYPRH